MCGRYAVTLPPDAMRALFKVKDRPNYPPRWNAAPTQDLPVIWRDPETGLRRLSLMRWGLVPFWAKAIDPKPVINARAETAAQKPMFRQALKKRRALIPADGFYEWAGEGRSKRPHFIHAAQGGPVAFAGLWEVWSDKTHGDVRSFAILTVKANADMADLHDRMPVILAAEQWAAWLDPEAAPLDLAPALDGALRAYEVSAEVGSAKNDGPRLIEPVERTRLF